MPKGPRGEKRPADVVGNAVLIAAIWPTVRFQTETLPRLASGPGLTYIGGVPGHRALRPRSLGRLAAER